MFIGMPYFKVLHNSVHKILHSELCCTYKLALMSAHKLCISMPQFVSTLRVAGGLPNYELNQ